MEAVMAYNTLEIIVSGYALDQLSRGCYMPITASNQGYILYIYIHVYIQIFKPLRNTHTAKIELLK